MKYFLIALFSLSILTASPVEQDDLGHFFNVNTVSGHFEMDFCDIEIKGPVPFALERSYTSSGALEANRDEIDLDLKSHRHSEWMFQSGWALHPRLNLFVGESRDAYLQGKRGLIKFTPSKPKNFHDADKKHYNYLKPEHKSSRASGKISSRNKIRNDYLKVKKIGPRRAVHYLANGTQRIYRCRNYYENLFWHLEKEILPSKHLIEYVYYPKKEKDRLKEIKIKNPAGDKTFTTITFDHREYEEEKKLKATCSNGQNATYFFLDEHKKREYLSKASNHSQVRSTYHYKPSRKGFGARLGGVSRVGKELFRVFYYLPSKKKKKKWAHKIRPKKYSDKVRELEIYDPLSRKFVSFATFSYQKGQTTIVDYEGNQTNYFHREGELEKVEYQNPGGETQCTVELTWKRGNLVRKLKRSGSGALVYEKKFAYDRMGNAVRETWVDHLSGLQPVVKYLTYTKNQLVKTVREEGGLYYEFTYFPKTDLINRKLTSANGEIIQREFFYYDEDHLLIATSVDDGKHRDPSQDAGATFRKIEKFDLDEKTGMCKRSSTYFYDFERRCDVFSKSETYTYDEKNQVIRIDAQYEQNGPVYTTRLEYDERGNVTGKISPLGRGSKYTFNEDNLLKKSKEPGASEKQFFYDHNGRMVGCKENGKKSTHSYDLKGRLVQSRDVYGNATQQQFDTFGNCISTTLPASLDEEGNPVISRAEMTYDTEGNILSHSDSLGNTTYTQYNSLRKPTRIIHPDQTETRHFYSLGGVVTKTINPDKTEIYYEYDHLQRVLSKKILTPLGELLSEEKWTYSTFHLLSHTDSSGLTTRYTYNCKGQKIVEDVGGRITRFEYDPFGNVKKVIKGDWKKVQKHNVAGEVTELWEETPDGKIENHMVFFYDKEGRKKRAIRHTSKGPAEDHFSYDPEGRLILHIDPEGNRTELQYREIENTLGQIVLEKTRIDALGNRLIETFDANHRLVSKECQNPSSQTVSYEEAYYDCAGNRTKRVATIFEDLHPSRTHTTRWEYDKMGRISKEIEEGEKVTSYTYDKMGRIKTKTLPNKIVITYEYDGLGRPTETKSSDGSVHYTYEYEKGNFPTKALDNIHNLEWEREFNIFDELLSERRPDGAQMDWEFDAQGRIVKLLLPDKSSIQYSYFGKHLIRVARVNADGREEYAHSYTSFDEWGHVATEEHILSLGKSITERDLLERESVVSSPFHTASISYGKTGLVETVENTLFPPKSYTYDALNQLTSEGLTAYHFDSLGNSTTSTVDHLNQVKQDGDFLYRYDQNGNTDSVFHADDFVHYSYDALNRLVEIRTKTKVTTYLYDPFSRLYSKKRYETEQGIFSTTLHSLKQTYLYNREAEIGTLDETQNIQELKVLGLGILGEIGAAVALEIQDQVYAPLHDFSGNIIALVDANSHIAETIEPDAFGRCVLKKAFINPWPFHSKRLEEELIFFGLRFYDPALGRFSTPDPLGPEASANLYLFAVNSPINRLDLFGLEDEEYRTETPVIHITEANTPSMVHVIAYYGENVADWLVFSNQFHQLQYTAEELESGTFDILNHFGELIPKNGLDGGEIALLDGRNGIWNTWENFENFGSKLYASVPDHILTIAEYTPAEGPVKDVNNTLREMDRKETTEAIMCEQSLRAIMNTLGKVNENLKFVNVLHSRGGAVSCAAIDRLSKEEREITAKKMLWLGLGAADTVRDEDSLVSKSIYSKNDWVTKGIGEYLEEKQFYLTGGKNLYNIEFVKSNKANGFKEHFFAGETYQNALEKFMREVNRDYGFVQPNR